MEYRRQAGRRDNVLLEKASPVSQGQQWIKHVTIETTPPGGDEGNMVEAVAEGRRCAPLCGKLNVRSLSLIGLQHLLPARP